MPGGKIEGIFTPNMVPLDARGEIDEPELRRYVDWLIAGGVHGLYPNGSTGEFTRFTPDERRRITRIVVEQAAGRVPVLAGAAEANVRETLAACEFYAHLGVRAVAIVSPFYYRLSPDNVYAFFREIGRNAPLDVTLYNIPLFASPIEVPTVQRLAEECERIVGMKDSSGDLAYTVRVLDAVRPLRPDFSFLVGWDPVLMPAMLMGADGGTNLTSGLVPGLTRRLFDTVRGGQLPEARKLQSQVLRLFDAVLYSADFPAGVRQGLEVLGFRMGAGRQPLADSQSADLVALRPTLEDLLAHPPASGSVDGLSAEHVEKIVHTVLAALRRVAT